MRTGSRSIGWNWKNKSFLEILPPSTTEWFKNFQKKMKRILKDNKFLTQWVASSKLMGNYLRSTCIQSANSQSTETTLSLTKGSQEESRASASDTLSINTIELLRATMEATTIKMIQEFSSNCSKHMEILKSNNNSWKSNWNNWKNIT